MKKNKLLIIFVIAIMIISISSIVFGAGFTNKVKNDKELDSTSEVVDKFNDVIGIIQVIATGIAVITLIALGIKYMVSSVGDRAEIKKHAVVYVVGAAILFGTSGLLQVIKLFSENMLK